MSDFTSFDQIDPGLNFDRIYRGVVVSNEDPTNKGRIKVWVPGIFAFEWKTNHTMLPWAELVMPMFGGSWTNENNGLNSEVGFCSVPHTSKTPGNGAQVWLFFEQGNHMLPKVFGACQGGEGWLTEHPNQHVIKTDNVRIRIDESPSDARSTSQFDSNNKNCTDLSKNMQQESMPTRVDIEIENETGCALNLIVKGDLNVKVEGNVYEEITGDKHETLIGNLYRKHVGDIHYVHEGDEVKEVTGDIAKKMKGSYTSTHSGDETKLTFGYVKEVAESKDVYAHNLLGIGAGSCMKTDVNGINIINVNGEFHENISGLKTVFSNKYQNLANEDIIHASNNGDIVEQSFSTTGSIIHKAMTLSRIGGTSISDIIGVGGTIDHNLTAFNLTLKVF